MYYVDNPEKLADNRRNQVNNRIDPCGSAVSERKLNSAKPAPVGDRRHRRR
jgi:hypothetical protein